MDNAAWSQEEVMALIDIWSDDTIQTNLDGMKRNKRVFERISHEMSARGFERTCSQCRNKIKALKSEYKRVKDNNNRSGRKRITCRYEKELDVILGGRPTTNPKHLVDTSHTSEDTSDETSDHEQDDEVNPDEDAQDEVNPDETMDTDLEEITDAVDKPIVNLEQDNPTPARKKPSIQRRPRVSKQKSIAEAIAYLAESQLKSDEMFVKLEERRLKLELQSEEKREKARMEYEERRAREKQDFEMKRMEMMMMMNNGKQYDYHPSTAVPQYQLDISRASTSHYVPTYTTLE